MRHRRREREVDTRAVGENFVVEAGVILALFEALHVDELRACGFIPETSSICLSIERFIQLPDERHTVDVRLLAGRRSNVDSTIGGEIALEKGAINVETTASTTVVCSYGALSLECARATSRRKTFERHASRGGSFRLLHVTHDTDARLKRAHDVILIAFALQNIQ